MTCKLTPHPFSSYHFPHIIPPILSPPPCNLLLPSLHHQPRRGRKRRRRRRRRSKCRTISHSQIQLIRNMSDRNPTEFCDPIPSTTPSKPRESKDKQIDLTHKQSTIQQSEHEAAIESEEKQGESWPTTTTTVVVVVEEEEEKDMEKEEKKNSEVTVADDSDSDSGRERLKKHRKEVAGHVWIPEKWGDEERLKDWMDCSVFNASLVPTGIVSARAALVEEGRQGNSGGLRIENACRLSL